MAAVKHLLKPRFKLVTFDVTNTLLKFHKTVGNAYSDVGLLYGVKSEPQKMDLAFRMHWKSMRQKYPNYGKSSGMSTKAWWSELVHRSFIETQPSVTEKQLKAISEDLYKRYTTGECWKLCSGAIEQLTILKEHQVILGVISNFDERLEPVLSVTGLKPYFQFILSSHFAGFEKPDARIFELALKQTCVSDIKACEAIHVGDDFLLDYMGAKNAGWNALLFDPWERNKTRSVENMKEVIRDMKDIHNHVFLL